MWEGFRFTYEQRDLSGKLFIRSKLLSLKMSEEQKLEDLLMKFDTLLNKLRFAGVELKKLTFAR